MVTRPFPPQQAKIATMQDLFQRFSLYQRFITAVLTHHLIEKVGQNWSALKITTAEETWLPPLENGQSKIYKL